MEQTTAEPISIRLRRDNCEDQILMRPLVSGLYEVLETPLLYGRVGRKDIVRLRPLGDGAYRVARVIQRPFQHWCWMIPGEYGYSQSIHEFYRWLEARGGEWESAMGGLLFVHLPQGDGTVDEVLAELNARIEVFRQGDERKRILEAGPPGMNPEQWKQMRNQGRKTPSLLARLAKLWGR